MKVSKASQKKIEISPMQEKIMRFVAKFLHHNRDETDPPDFGVRVLIHIPMGYIAVMSVEGHWVLPLVITWVFLKYERNEDVHTEDQAWKDIMGFLVGAVMGVITRVWLKLSGIV